jgi:hypothetical protein
MSVARLGEEVSEFEMTHWKAWAKIEAEDAKKAAKRPTSSD